MEGDRIHQLFILSKAYSGDGLSPQLSIVSHLFGISGQVLSVQYRLLNIDRKTEIPFDWK
jgi:hypothetical protein